MNTHDYKIINRAETCEKLKRKKMGPSQFKKNSPDFLKVVPHTLRLDAEMVVRNKWET